MRIFRASNSYGPFAGRRGIAFDMPDDTTLTQENTCQQLEAAGGVCAGAWFQCDDCGYCFCEWDRRPYDKRFPDFPPGWQAVYSNDKGQQTCFACAQLRKIRLRREAEALESKVKSVKGITPAKHPIQADDKMKAFLAANGQKTNAEKFGGAPA